MTSKFPVHPERRPVVVTGASSGIGQATAEALAAEGHPVVIGARRLGELQGIAESIRADGGEAHAFHLDLADPDSVTRFVDAALAAVGEVEVVVANAARNQVGAILETPPEELEAVLDVNVGGAHRLISALLPPMVERRRGDVVVVTSDVVTNPRPSMAAYVTSKWGLEGYVRALQMELEGSGVRVSIVRPGPTLTEMGWDWDMTRTEAALAEWARWGLVRHDSYMRPSAVARAVAAVVAMPRGAQITSLEIHPEAPVREDD
ncbi:MAG: SDR family oxidoreductase [Actinomycetes bacterium]